MNETRFKYKLALHVCIRLLVVPMQHPIQQDVLGLNYISLSLIIFFPLINTEHFVYVMLSPDLLPVLKRSISRWGKAHYHAWCKHMRVSK